MVAKELLEILACPESKQPVRLAEDDVVVRINERIRRQELLNRAGVRVTESASGFLIREDNEYGYLIREDIPIMLVEEAIPAAQFR